MSKFKERCKNIDLLCFIFLDCALASELVLKLRTALVITGFGPHYFFPMPLLKRGDIMHVWQVNLAV
jgi:hypothetical protein